MTPYHGLLLLTAIWIVWIIAEWWGRNYVSHPRAADLRDIRDRDQPDSALIAQNTGSHLRGLPQLYPLGWPNGSRYEPASGSDLARTADLMSGRRERIASM